MNKETFPYPEDTLQWIWQQLLFNTQDLKTEECLSIHILDQGTLNPTDGPDFKNAKIQIDGITWYGAVELHLNSSGWNQHGHHLDEAYNQVVLHVVVEDNPRPIYTKGGASVPVLNLLPHLPGELESFVREMQNSTQLPCVSGLSYISKQAFELQITKAHREYLEKKSSDFLSFFNPELPSSIAWKDALILSVFDGFGITHNREPMQEMGRWFLEQSIFDLDVLTSSAWKYASSGSGLVWNHRGVYPANHPKKRVTEAIHLSLLIKQTPFEAFLDKEVLFLWRKWIEEAGLSGSGKAKILFGIVYLPALYVLSSLYRVNTLSELLIEEWMQLKIPIPSVFEKPFRNIEELNKDSYSRKLGSVHQIRSYCNKRRCHECFVLKKVISS